jgi:hypothetical protein
MHAVVRACVATDWAGSIEQGVKSNPARAILAAAGNSTSNA